MQAQVLSSFDIPRGARVAPLDDRTALVLSRGRAAPSVGTVIGHAGRGGDYVLVRWDGAPQYGVDDTVHWRNVRVL